ncbi:serine hydrolase [Acaryochloris sp. IP29b_bin.148]|uniref:serine hydrolase n=1 Tax=Acaryochloris sp. IP29b_bin.148 TaxID=2969218 RepID=UPI00261385E6|nr:serine hydrolase [Acaryochloris sp. IP29b_bin.148]
MLQHAKRPLTSRQQRQLWQQRRRAHQARRAMRKQQLLRQRVQAQPPRRAHPARDRQVLPTTTPGSRSHSLNQRQRSVRPSPSVSSRSAPLRRPRRSSRRLSWFSYLARLGIVGSGVAAIAGTILTLLDPAPSSRQAASSSLISPAASVSETTSKQQVVPKTFDAQPETPTSLFYRWSQEPRLTRLIREGQELTQIKQQIQQWSAAQTGLTPVMFFLNPETGDYLNIQGEHSVSAASTIKIPVLFAFLEDVDAGKIDLEEPLVMRKDLVATEAGSMQYQPVGTQFSALETAEYMIAISDNTATNMLIDRLGGMDKLNQRFRSWGLKHTVLRNPLPDLEGTNTISPQDMAALMLKLTDDTLLSAASREQAVAILQQTVTDTLLPQGLDNDATIAHKTGDIGSVVGDIGLIEMPNGQHYVAAILVQRPHNDPRAQELIRKISKLTYRTFRQAPPASSAASRESGD